MSGLMAYRRWLAPVWVALAGLGVLSASGRAHLAAALAMAALAPVVAPRDGEDATGAWPADAVLARGVCWEAEPSTLCVRNVAGDLEGTLGYSAERWLADPAFWPGHIAPEDRDRVLQACRSVLNDGREHVRLEYRALAAGGERVQVETRLEVVRDSGGRPRTLKGWMVNLAEERRILEALSQSRKMAEMGRLAGGVAHDFNNLLTVIGGHAELLLASLDAHDPRRRSVDEIRKAGQRAAALTRQLLAFSRRRDPVRERLDLHEVVESMSSMLKRLIGEDVDLVTVSKQGLGCVLADRGQVEQVIVNLVVNARDAVAVGGRVSIEIGECEIGSGGERCSVPPGRYLTLSVKDNGCGMDASTQSRIFEAFFTTKGEGRGTGLGLATVRDIVRECGGGIEVQSRVGQGSVFRIIFPKAPGTEGASAVTASAVTFGAGQETVLVAEDDDNVRAMSCQILESLGYDVLRAASGEDAQQLSLRHEGPIHLLVSDVVMPRIDGPALAILLKKRRPELKVLFMSGYTRETILRLAAMDPEISYLQKPFTPATLSSAVRTTLDGEAGAVRDSCSLAPS